MRAYRQDLWDPRRNRADDSTAEQNCRVRSPVAGRDLISQPRLGLEYRPLYHVFFDDIRTDVWVYIQHGAQVEELGEGACVVKATQARVCANFCRESYEGG